MALFILLRKFVSSSCSQIHRVLPHTFFFFKHSTQIDFRRSEKVQVPEYINQKHSQGSKNFGTW